MGMTGFESTKAHPIPPDETESSPGETFDDLNKPSDRTLPGQAGRESSAAGGRPGALGNLPPMQDRPFTPLGTSVGPAGTAQRPKS